MDNASAEAIDIHFSFIFCCVPLHASVGRERVGGERQKEGGGARQKEGGEGKERQREGEIDRDRER